MATLTIGLSGSGVVNGTKNYTISDPGVTSFIAWARATYPFAGTVDTRTAAQCLVQWTDNTTTALKDAVTKKLKDEAAASAYATTTGIVIT